MSNIRAALDDYFRDHEVSEDAPDRKVWEAWKATPEPPAWPSGEAAVEQLAKAEHDKWHEVNRVGCVGPQHLEKARRHARELLAALNPSEPATPPNLVRNQDGTYHCQGCDGGDIDWSKPAAPSAPLGDNGEEWHAHSGLGIHAHPKPAAPPAPGAPPWPDWTVLANVIREVDGNHDLGAGELATRILAHPALPSAPPWPDGEEAALELSESFDRWPEWMHDQIQWMHGKPTDRSRMEVARAILTALREGSKPTGGTS